MGEQRQTIATPDHADSLGLREAMLSEAFVTSVLSAEGSKRPSNPKDAGIYIHNFQPNQTLQSSFKKSATTSNCLAVSETHIFAAQNEKAVVHVYSRDRGIQEATVPFPERIHSVSFAGYAGGAGVLALGTQGGRVILWEICTGRQVTTPASHLQPVTTLAVDLNSNFLLSGSEDSNIHVWSINSLLSFSNLTGDGLSTTSKASLRHTLSKHRAAITSLVTGHSSSATNIAISASKDSTCIVWNYQAGDVLRTFLFSTPSISLTLDPCNRAFYAGHEDGSIQLINFFKQASAISNPLHDPLPQSTPIQAPASDLWAAASQKLGATLCLDVVYEGNYLLTGHASGKVCLWDVASGKFVKEITDHGVPVTNLIVLPPTGFPMASSPRLKVHQIIKPRYESGLPSSNGRSTGIVPLNYTLTAQFASTLPSEDNDLSTDPLEAVFNHPSLPPSFIAASLAELAAFTSSSSSSQRNTNRSIKASSIEDQNLKQQVSELQTKLDDLRSTHKQTWKKMVEMRLETLDLQKKEQARIERRRRRKRRDEGGESSSSRDEDDDDDEDGGSRSSPSLIQEQHGNSGSDDDATEVPVAATVDADYASDGKSESGGGSDGMEIDITT